MEIVYSDFDEAQSREYISNLDFSFRDLVEAKTEEADGLVIAGTEDLKNLGLIDWEWAMSPEHVKVLSYVRDEPDYIKESLEAAVVNHDSSSEMVVDFKFYRDPSPRSRESKYNKHVITVCEWSSHSGVMTPQDLVGALNWLAE